MQCSWNFHCCYSSRCAPRFTRDVHTEIFAEAVRDKIIDTEIIAALGRAISDTTPPISYRSIKFFTAAAAKGVLHSFSGIFIPKYSQRGFGTRYLILKSSLHLYVHSAVKTTSVQSISSLLPSLEVRSIFFTGYSFRNIRRGRLEQHISHCDYRHSWTCNG